VNADHWLGVKRLKGQVETPRGLFRERLPSEESLRGATIEKNRISSRSGDFDGPRSVVGEGEPKPREPPNGGGVGGGGGVAKLVRKTPWILGTPQQQMFVVEGN